MKKTVFFLLPAVFFLSWTFLLLPAGAAPFSPDIEDLLEQQMEELDFSQVESAVPPQAKEGLSRLNLSSFSIQSLLSLSPSDFFRLLWEDVKAAVLFPIHILGETLGIVILCGLLAQLNETAHLTQFYSAVSIACILSLLAGPITDCIFRTVEILKNGSVFMLSFVPVLSGIVAAGGQPASAGGYHFLVFFMCQVVSKVAGDMLMPGISIYYALCICASVFPQIPLRRITSTIKSIVCWSLGALASLFVGILSMQTLVSTGLDTIASKATRFLISSFIPVVGGALSDAFATAQGCIDLLRGAVGSFGILVAFFTVLPVLLKVVSLYIVVKLSAAIGEMLSAQQAASFLQYTASTLSILFSFILYFSLVVIISTTLVLMIGST